MIDKAEDAINTLIELRRNDPVVQRAHRRDLERCFKVFWDSCPDEETFTKISDGLLFTPRMIYYMVMHPVLKMDEATVTVTAPIQAPQGKGGRKK